MKIDRFPTPMPGPASHDGWRRAAVSPPCRRSLVRSRSTSRHMAKDARFSGPGLLVAVGYMDPGNWATDLQGGAQFGYALLSVILISNLMAILLQHSGAEAGHRHRARSGPGVPRPLSRGQMLLWVLCEIAIAACDLAEVIGSAIALQLLFGMPLMWACCSLRSMSWWCCSCKTKAFARSKRWWSADPADRRLFRL